MSEQIGQSLGWGVGIALVQATLSTVALKWAWKRPFFYWVWGGGVVVRLLVFFATAFVVVRYSQLNLVAVLLSLIFATTLFLVVESRVLKGK